ncbi:hypothetical protein KC340_g7747 [Hortaea werneckii]|nr:hypothetical protein KC342_g7951 [Hortaea werneckii]KAI7096827.1 hypothetical protein KC339_g10116 [Hortaea werneckii]KAI7228527.1 hypothetical protein KC365_g8427 [Hortaea werneckii]KAI7319895.1 hypothetical protein KC340_g7747 [Hortaea werneckii]KAI7400153.1 hypothetical protein KC328_g3681 [Hortaea werneckii]
MLRDSRVGSKYCVLDGLDECDEVSQRWLVAKLVELVSGDGLGSSNTVVKIAIISRPDVSGLAKCTQVRLDPDNDKQVGKDIQSFVSSRVQELASRKLPPELLHEVRTTLLDRSEGTFLWIGFAMIELLKKKTATDVQRALYSLPKGLPGIYGRLVLQIEEEHRHTSLLILRWVTLAFRPLSLPELAAAVGTQTPPLLDPMQAIRDQISMCGALVKVEGETASLVHSSARDYLLRSNRDDDEILERFRIKPRQSHTELAAACVDYLVQTNDQYQEVPLNSTRPTAQLLFRLRVFRLRDYAVEHWPDHAKASSMAGIKLLANGKFFDKESCVREVWWREYSQRSWNVPLRLSTLHIASYLGIPKLAQSLIEKRKKQLLNSLRIRGYVDKRDDCGHTPLWWAARRGHEAVVRLLLATSKVDPNAWNHEGETPLIGAAGAGHKAVVQLLLATSKVDADAHSGRVTPLSVAAEGGHEAVVRLLLATGKVDVNNQTCLAGTPLSVAAGGGHEAVVRLLLATSKVDPDAFDYAFRRTPLWAAAEAGYDAVVRLLLATGKVDVNARDSDSRTPLLIAAYRGNKAVVRLLLATDKVNVEAQDNFGQTPLFVAVIAKHEAVVQLLLAIGKVDVNVHDKLKRTLLWWAVVLERKAIVQLLLATDKVDVDAEDISKLEPLSAEMRQLLQEYYLRHHEIKEE